jgi:4-amino-4-deoxy-L-arabinose transferase-like glycosyltransferase
VVSGVIRTLALGEALWMDEGLSIGLASQPLLDIPGDLRQDGNPPLYYMLLHVWIQVFGDGPAETQAMSVAIALLAVPIGLWAGWSLFGRRAGLIAAALGALNPFLTTYAQETRMYSLMVVLSIALTAAFVHVYIYRNRGYLPVFGVVLALMLYTHSWGLFVTFGALVAFVAALLEMEPEGRRELIRDGLLGFGIALLLYLPWIPTLLYQATHTGAPWVNPPRLGVVVQISKWILGGGTVTVALLLAGGSGLAAIMVLARRRAADRDPDAVREYRAVIAVAVLGLTTLAIAWIVSQFAPAWTTRYLGVTLGPLIVIACLGLARAGNLGLVALVIIMGIWAIPKTSQLENKSNAADLGAAAADVLEAGDLVVVLQPEQTPLIEYHLRDEVPGLIWANQLGRVENPELMDWRDGMERMEDATPEANLDPLLASLPRSARVLLVHPVTTQRNDWDAPWTELVRRRSAQWGRAMEEDARFTRSPDAVPEFYRRANRIGVRGVLYTKTGA